MKGGCFLQKSQNLQRFIGAGGDAGDFGSHLSRAAVLFSRLYEGSGHVDRLFPHPDIRWVATVVEEERWLLRARLLLVFDVLVVIVDFRLPYLR